MNIPHIQIPPQRTLHVPIVSRRKTLPIRPKPRQIAEISPCINSCLDAKLLHPNGTEKSDPGIVPPAFPDTGSCAGVGHLVSTSGLFATSSTRQFVAARGGREYRRGPPFAVEHPRFGRFVSSEPTTVSPHPSSVLRDGSDSEDFSAVGAGRDVRHR